MTNSTTPASPSFADYDRHHEEWAEVLSNPERRRVAETWFRTDTLDYRRHARMREPAKAFIRVDPDATWLTVGDGRFGTDAHYLLQAGARSVHCTDYSAALLKAGSDLGFIRSFSSENAESLSFEDASFDYVYCKEAFHHFPRAYIALYEMFRVARKAVILTEPRDQFADSAPFAWLFYLLTAPLRRSGYRHDFETVGNYVFTVSEREIEKFLLGMHYNWVAFTGCNDVFLPGVERVPMPPRSFQDWRTRAELDVKGFLLDLLCKAGLRKKGMLTAALFKEAPSEQTVAALLDAGWVVRQLPGNPYR